MHNSNYKNIPQFNFPFKLHRCGILAMLIFFLFTSCSYKRLNQLVYSPLIIDSSKFITTEKLKELESSFTTPGIKYIIQVVDSLDKLNIGSLADKMADSIISSNSDKEEFKKRAVYLLVSKRESLVQVRVSKELFIQAYFGGIISGQTYSKIQNSAKTIGLNQALINMVTHLSKEIPKIYNKSFFQSMIYNSITQEIILEIEELGTPSESFYSNDVLKPLLKISLFTSKYFKGWWVSFLLSVLLVYLVRSLLKYLFKSIFSGITKRPNVVALLNVIVNFIIDIAIIIPPIQVAISLSGARVEDQISLNASGINLSKYFIWPDYFSEGTSFWFVLLIAIVRFFKGVVENRELMKYANLDKHKQVQLHAFNIDNNPLNAHTLEILAHGRYGDANVDRFSEAPYSYTLERVLVRNLFTGIRWGLLCWLFFIKGFALLILLFIIFDIAFELIKDKFLQKRHSHEHL
ncbi:hypothetical protein SAMN05518672_10614 [Chitinophaga sp. CF118]|uniref:hypothetical protein n=1 Tax=Chitinophaga sp. CF118 TaxID=1884367 RepID=UPI0008E5BEA1|nr:hypothetical protein [Chitinophaga sp. CF118]SFE40337.1 hypothetical protein SAMN05518672_10614 [Chitinophaga sp. CF118]